MIEIQKVPIWMTFWEPWLGHKIAIFWPFLEKGVTGYTLQCQIWHGASLGTSIKMKWEPIWQTILGACLGHKRTYSGNFYEKGTTGVPQNYEIWHGALGTLIMIQEEPSWRTRWGPCFGHKRAIFLPFLGKGDYGIHPELWNLAWSIPGHINYDSGRTNFKDHVRTMFWP